MKSRVVFGNGDEEQFVFAARDELRYVVAYGVEAVLPERKGFKQIEQLLKNPGCRIHVRRLALEEHDDLITTFGPKEIESFRTSTSSAIRRVKEKLMHLSPPMVTLVHHLDARLIYKDLHWIYYPEPAISWQFSI